MKKEGGFTLIELLVVIAVIGILAAVVLASLNSARTKGRDAAVKSNLATVRVQAQLYYDIYGKYRNPTASGVFSTATCTTGTTMFGDNTGSSIEGQGFASVINSAILTAHVAGGSGGMLCNQDATNEKYVVFVRMNSGTIWCVDSAGAAKDIGATMPGAATYSC